MQIMARTFALFRLNVKQIILLTIIRISALPSVQALNLHLANGIPEDV